MAFYHFLQCSQHIGLGYVTHEGRMIGDDELEKTGKEADVA